VAVMPFKAPVELAGASISDMFATEILKTYKYQLVERSQMEQVLGEQALGLKGVIENSVAIRVGKMLGVQGVIIGTVPEYGMRAVGSSELPSVGINVRMIDVETGAIVWSVTDSAIASKPISISAFARHLVESMVFRLKSEWIAAGDTFAINLPSAQIVSHRGRIRAAVVEVFPDPPQSIKGYRLLRSRTRDGVYSEVGMFPNTGKSAITLEDTGLLDAETYYYLVETVSVHALSGPPVGPFKITTTGPPRPVMELRAESGWARRAPLYWTPVSEQEVKGYMIFRSAREHGPYEMIKFIKGAEQNHYVDKGKPGGFFGPAEGLGDAKKYFYKIQVVNVVDVRSPDSPVAYAVTKPVPVSVSGVQTNQLEVKQVTISWTPSPEEDIAKYEIYRGDSPDNIKKHVKSVPAANGARLTFTDTSLDDGRTYFYRIRAIDKDRLVGEFSERVVSLTKPVPEKPVGLDAQLWDGGIRLTWKRNAEDDITHYEVHERSFLWRKIGETPEILYRYNSELKPGKTFTFRIKAVDATNLKSDPSDEISVTIPK